MIVRDPEARPASDAQISYLYALLDDGFDSDLIDDGFLPLRLGREPQGVNDITVKEARAVIDELKELGCKGYKSREDY